MFFETVHAVPTSHFDSAPLPADVVLTQRAAALLRAYLSENDLGHYPIFHCGGSDLYDVEWYLAALGETDARWQPVPAFISGGDLIGDMETPDGQPARLADSGILRLAEHEVVIARWHWIDDNGALGILNLFAARSAAHFARLQADIARQRRGGSAAVWQVIRGHGYKDGPRPPRVAGDELLLTDALRRRVETDIIRFFTDEVARLYCTLRVPHRRGVLLHGPPGNGKTSLIRHVGVQLPEIPVMILRPGGNFGGDHFESAIRRWRRQAPAILVIEDLNWLLEHVNVSMFLNLLDGIDSASFSGGLLLIATTNYPEDLDPAINNRPGRFDVVIEIPAPDRALRLAFLRRHLAEMATTTLERVADETPGLSFAHLQEILRLSGLNAIHAGRATRSDADVTDAATTVRATHDEAIRGFPQKPEMPFGLLPLRK
jgi:hypothetical protein